MTIRAVLDTNVVLSGLMWHGTPHALIDRVREGTLIFQLGARIAALRKDQAMTQVQLAESMAVSQQTVASWEVGRRGVPVSNLPLLARTLGISVEALIGEKTPPARRGPTPKLQQQVERLSRLPQAKQRVVMEMLEGFLNQAARTG